MRALAAGEPFMQVKAEGRDVLVFSEGFLYDCMYKDDARFVLAVAEEYERVILLLGIDRVRELLGKGPTRLSDEEVESLGFFKRVHPKRKALKGRE